MGEKNTLIDALNAEMLSDIQKMHQKLEVFKADMELVAGASAATKASTESIKENLDESVKKFEMMAKGIILFAKDESAKIQVTEKEHQKVTSDHFMARLKENTSSFKSQLWIIFLILGINFVMLLAILLRQT